MDTRQAKRAMNCKYWAQLIRQKNDSGMTVKDFCQTHGINIKRYYYWQQIIRSTATAQPAAAETDTPVLVPVSVANAKHDPVSSTGSLTIQYGSYEITVTQRTSASLLKQTLQLLQEVAPS